MPSSIEVQRRPSIPTAEDKRRWTRTGKADDLRKSSFAICWHKKMRDARDKVRRRLFANEEENGGDRRIENGDDLMERQLEMQTKRWNFDFRNEVPLEGPWVWEKIGGPQVPPVGNGLLCVGTVTPDTRTEIPSTGTSEEEIVSEMEEGENQAKEEEEAQR